jgi:beta-glucosidase
LARLFPDPTPDELAMAEAFMRGGESQSQVDDLSGGDRDRLALHAEDEALIEAIAGVNPRIIVAVMGGSAVVMEAWRQQVPAILMVWYPGMEGGHALADVLLGRVNPCGKLPLVIPQCEEHLPFFDKNATEIEYDLWHGYRKLERDGNDPAFPFGFGLSYTSYRYADLALESDHLSPSDTLDARLRVSNTGTRAGEEVVQVYVSAIGSRVERAPKELKAFTRVALQPGESKTVRVSIPASRLAYYDEARAEFVVEPIEYELFVGAHSLDADGLRARFAVRAE